MSRRVGAVDIGTNSTRLLVADVSESGGIAEVERLLEITRLGDRVDAERRLTDEAIARVDAVLERYAARAAELEAEPVLAVATSAVRDAAERCASSWPTRPRGTGSSPRLLTGEEEAEMTYRGVCSRAGGGRRHPDLRHRRRLDRAHPRRPRAACATGASLDIGCVRLSERHLHADPPTPAEVDAVARRRGRGAAGPADGRRAGPGRRRRAR